MEIIAIMKCEITFTSPSLSSHLLCGTEFLFIGTLLLLKRRRQRSANEKSAHGEFESMAPLWHPILLATLQAAIEPIASFVGDGAAPAIVETLKRSGMCASRVVITALYPTSVGLNSWPVLLSTAGGMSRIWPTSVGLNLLRLCRDWMSAKSASRLSGLDVAATSCLAAGVILT